MCIFLVWHNYIGIHIEKATRAACRYLKDAYAKYKYGVAVAASYNAGQARIASQLAKQDVDDSLDLQLVEAVSYTHLIRLRRFNKLSILANKTERRSGLQI